MAHACNSNYSGGRDQEDRGSKPVQANSSCDPILKKPITITKKDWWSGSRYMPRVQDPVPQENTLNVLDTELRLMYSSRVSDLNISY
jgi:hypothetical protein